MPRFLVSRTCQPEADGLVQHARALNWPIQWLNRQRPPQRLPADECCFYGETDLALGLMQEHDLALLEPTLDLLSQFPPEFLGRRIRFMRLEAARQLKEPTFIKPADCTHKAFEAKVYEEGRWLRVAADATESIWTLASDPVDWEVEYRVIVHDRQVVTFSPYIRGGWLAKTRADEWPSPEEETAAMLAFCGRVLACAAVDLPPAFTLDVGRIAGADWAIVEVNPVWCSGLLGCQLSKLLVPLARACRRQSSLTTDDRRWVVQRDQV